MNVRNFATALLITATAACTETKNPVTDVSTRTGTVYGECIDQKDSTFVGFGISADLIPYYKNQVGKTLSLDSVYHTSTQTLPA